MMVATVSRVIPARKVKSGEKLGLFLGFLPLWILFTAKTFETLCFVLFFIYYYFIYLFFKIWNFINLFVFIYLFLAALGLCCCARAFSSCGEQGLLFVVVLGLLIGVASLVAEHGL